MARVARRSKMVFTEEAEDAGSLERLLDAALPPITPATLKSLDREAAALEASRISPTGEMILDDPDAPPPPPLENPRPYPGEPDPYEHVHEDGIPHTHEDDPHTHGDDPLLNPGNNVGEGDDSDVANPDVPGSTPRNPHPKPEDGDPTPDPDPDNPDEEEGEDEEDGDYEDNPSRDNRPNPHQPLDPGPGGAPTSPAQVGSPAELDAARAEVYRRQRPGPTPHTTSSPSALNGEIMPRSSRYEARISILDAFHYPGSLREAPEWVDRNWVGYGDEDPMRGIPAGPCLRVPRHNVHEDVVLARIGDYVTRQEVRLAVDIPGDIRVEVWAKDQFEKMFLPV